MAACDRGAKLFMDIALDSEWVREMGQAHVDLLIECLKYCITLGAKPDGLFLVDDFGCTRGLLFSPAMWRDIFKPLYARLAKFLHVENISLWLHSCGDVRALIPDMIDAGLDVLQPLQVAAGMDLRELVPQYGDHSVPPEVSFYRYQKIMEWVHRYGLLIDVH